MWLEVVGIGRPMAKIELNKQTYFYIVKHHSPHNTTQNSLTNCVLNRTYNLSYS